MAAAFLFCSGAAALIYQTVWLREFRLIFGASTFATAAVLAIFMGGLGAGSAILGKRADEREAPLAFYGMLEIGVALSAALSPLLLILIRKLYIALGGSVTLGLFFATVVRLIFATLVLAIPTFLMGGTLPAAARAVVWDEHVGRSVRDAGFDVLVVGGVGEQADPVCGCCVECAGRNSGMGTRPGPGGDSE
jgi:spermidine synthase